MSAKGDWCLIFSAALLVDFIIDSLLITMALSMFTDYDSPIGNA